jgi:hypothetical protein
MSGLAQALRKTIPSDTFTDTEVFGVAKEQCWDLPGYLRTAISSGDLIRLRQGVYCFGKRLRRGLISSYEAAHKIYPFCHISLESALSYHGWIPEAVFTTTSVTWRKSAKFETPLGMFSFTRMPECTYQGVERVVQGNAIFLIATPTKALADYVVVHKVDDPPMRVFGSLRIEEESYAQVDSGLFAALAETYRSKRLERFERELRLIR